MIGEKRVKADSFYPQFVSDLGPYYENMTLEGK